MYNIPERDWKYLRSIQRELLENLCARINGEASRMLADPSLGHHDKFLRLFDNVMDNNGVLADCFDDWRRSNILHKVFGLRRQRLLTDEHMSHLSAETRSRIDLIDRI